jgi:hypothetical protein
MKTFPFFACSFLLAACLLAAPGCGWLLGMNRSDLAGDAGNDLADADEETDRVDLPDLDMDADDAFEFPSQCDSDEDCDNGVPCDGKETCVDEKCQVGTPLNNGDPCTVFVVVNGFCQDGECIPLSCGDGTTDPGEECDDGNDVQDDGCRTNCHFSCDLNSECEDDEPCTTDLCQVQGNSRFCVHFPNHDPCNDADTCTIRDRCQDGTCSGGLPNPCDDDEQCTDDSCDPSTGCVNEAKDTGSCNDGDSCTGPDTCQAGECVSGGNTCACTDNCSSYNANPCNGTYNCIDGTCRLTPFDDCHDDADTPCEKNRCVDDDEAPDGYHCEMQTLTDGTSCDDGSVCTSGETCVEGVCTPAEELDCDDGNPCTEDTCNALSGCQHGNTIDECFDGLFCTLLDQCDGNGNCSGTVRPCADTEECTVDFCDEGTDQCVYLPFSDFTPCGEEGQGYCCKSGICQPCDTP